MKITIPTFRIKSGRVIIALAVLVLVNFASYNYFFRVDVTSDRTYSISEGTIKTLKELSHPVEVNLYISNNLPAQYGKSAQYLEDVMNEYKAYGDKLTINKIDPIADESKAVEANKSGVNPIEFQVLDRDEFKVQKGYLGLTIINKDDETKKEVIPFFQSTDGLEYQLTSVLRKITSDEQKIVGFLTGHGEFGINSIPPQLLAQLGAQAGQLPNGEYSEFAEGIRKNYEVKAVNLNDENALDGIGLLIIGGPKEDFPDEDLLKLDQYIMNGGLTIFMVDGVNVDAQAGLSASVGNEKIREFLKNYGIEILPELIIDKSNETAAFNGGTMQYVLPYPFWVKTLEKYYATSPLTSKISTVSFAFASPINLTKLEGSTVNSMIKSTEFASTQVAPFNLDPTQKFNFAGGSSKTIVGEVTGTFKSYFEGKPLPVPEDKKKKPVITAANLLSQSVGNATILAVSDSDFLSNDYLQRFDSNLNFGLNMVDYLLADPSLIAIRGKAARLRALDKVSDNQTTMIRIINIGAVPLVVLGLGLLRYSKRKKSI